ncbi:MAG: hypothetical protein P4L46_10905 [Fimbriimonas sp.]|nr:hypothetical protein [Fimbriimonas sp.]
MITGWLLWFAAFAFAGSPGATGVDGRIHQPLREARGKPLVMLFLSHDCPIGNAYAPELSRIRAAYSGRVAFALAYAEPRITAAMGKAHAASFSLQGFELLLDPKGVLSTFCHATVTPEAVVFDAQGRQEYCGRIDDRYPSLGRQKPAATTHDLRDALDAILAHRSPKPALGPPVGCTIVHL